MMLGSLKAELAAVRDRYEASAAEAQASRREVEQLRHALGVLDARVTEYQRNDADVYGRIRAAMEEAEEARLARDSALVGQKELQKEAEVGFWAFSKKSASFILTCHIGLSSRHGYLPFTIVPPASPPQRDRPSRRFCEIASQQCVRLPRMRHTQSSRGAYILWLSS